MSYLLLTFQVYFGGKIDLPETGASWCKHLMRWFMLRYLCVWLLLTVVAQVRAEGSANHLHWQAHHCPVLAHFTYRDIMFSPHFKLWPLCLTQSFLFLTLLLCGSVCLFTSRNLQPATTCSVCIDFVIMQGAAARVSGSDVLLARVADMKPPQDHCMTLLLYCSDPWTHMTSHPLASTTPSMSCPPTEVFSATLTSQREHKAF